MREVPCVRRCREVMSRFRGIGGLRDGGLDSGYDGGGGEESVSRLGGSIIRLDRFIYGGGLPDHYMPITAAVFKCTRCRMGGRDSRQGRQVSRLFVLPYPNGCHSVPASPAASTDREFLAVNAAGVSPLICRKN